MEHGMDFVVCMDTGMPEVAEKLWMVIKTMKSSSGKGYKISEGDIIKLGRVKFRVKKIETN
jgi:hypothetical protein